MTERLYYSDSYLRAFDATVLAVEGDLVVLDRTAFYPTSGGQSHDTGRLGEARVIDVAEGGDGRILHRIEGPPPSGAVHGRLDWPRRFDHMQQHTGQHLLSAVFHDHFGWNTLSVHFGDETCTVDLETPAVPPEALARAERIANDEIAAHRAITVCFEDAATAVGLRKPSDRPGQLRIVTIEGLDRSACGGTHVRATAEIGGIVLRRTEKIRQSTRVEFVCGLRALTLLTRERNEAREALAAQQARAAELDKQRLGFAKELASYRGRDLHAATAPDATGLRRVLRQVEAIDDATRAEANAFIAGGKALYVAAAGLSALVAASPDSGRNAGALVKQFATKGGGTATLAQGSFASEERIAALSASAAE